MSTNLTTVATAAAQYLGVLDSGEGLSSQQLADALAAMNNILDNWSTDPSMIPAVTRTVTSGSMALTWTALTQFPDATTPITIPPGYLLVYELTLAIVLAPQYDMPASKELVAAQADEVSRIRKLNEMANSGAKQ